METKNDIEHVLGIDDILPTQLEDFSVAEVFLGESLLTPGLQTAIRIQATKSLDNPDFRNFDLFRGKNLTIELKSALMERNGLPFEMLVRQPIYRLDNRFLYTTDTVYEMTFHACHDTLLRDAATLVSKYWHCKTPSQITEDVLGNCVGAREMMIESSQFPRDYVAENIHPFQVVSQQANAALADGNDPSFVHFMTYNPVSGDGVHNFRSLKKMTQQTPINDITINPYRYNQTDRPNSVTKDPWSIEEYSFPCDFDLLTDILNGVGNSTAITFNDIDRSFNIHGTKTGDCGIGATSIKTALSSFTTARQQGVCPDYSHLFIQKRQARMSLIDKNRIALRMVVPWNPSLHAGSMISVKFEDMMKNPPGILYGTGEYLIVSLKHNLKLDSALGGPTYAITMLDCVSKTVGEGIV